MEGGLYSPRRLLINRLMGGRNSEALHQCGELLCEKLRLLSGFSTSLLETQNLC